MQEISGDDILKRFGRVEKIAAYALVKERLETKLKQLENATDENEKRALGTQIRNLRGWVNDAQSMIDDFVDINNPLSVEE